MTGVLKLILSLSFILPAQVLAKNYSEKSLETLFTSSQQRRDIEKVRNRNTSSGNQLGPAKLKINGIVKRSNGKNVVWVNGKSTLKNTMVDGVKVFPNAVNRANKIPVLIDGRKVYFKPGEAWSGEAGVSGVGE